VGREHSDIIAAAGAEYLEVFGQRGSFDVERRVEFVQPLAQARVCGHRLERLGNGRLGRG
jgi:hypothetical protein